MALAAVPRVFRSATVRSRQRMNMSTRQQHQPANTSTYYNIINMPTPSHQYINKPTCQHQHANTSTSTCQHLHINKPTRQHQHFNTFTSISQHVNIMPTCQHHKHANTLTSCQHNQHTTITSTCQHANSINMQHTPTCQQYQHANVNTINIPTRQHQHDNTATQSPASVGQATPGTREQRAHHMSRNQGADLVYKCQLEQ